MTAFKVSPRGSWLLALRLAAAGVALSLAAACAATGTDPAKPGQAASTATEVKPAKLAAGQDVPLTKKPILAVGGKISNPNDGDVLQLGVDTLDQFRLMKVNVYEPWAKERMGFQGVWLADVLDAAGVDGSASGVHVAALDDYGVDLTMAEIDAGGILLATKSQDGSPIAIDEGGPTRVVFLDGVGSGASPDQWIWSLKDISVR